MEIEVKSPETMPHNSEHSIPCLLNIEVMSTVKNEIFPKFHYCFLIKLKHFWYERKHCSRSNHWKYCGCCYFYDFSIPFQLAKSNFMPIFRIVTFLFCCLSLL